MFTYDWLLKRAGLSPKKTALIDAFTGRQFTYVQLNQRASRFAEFLRDEWGIRPGDRVALLAHNSTDFIEILFGCAKVGAIMIPLNWRLAIPELEFIINDSTPRALIYDAEFSEEAATILQSMGSRLGLVITTEASGQGITYESALSHTSGQRVEMPPKPLDETWYILYTSGTTGRPKGVLQTFAMALFNSLNIGLPVGLSGTDTTLNLLPFFHTGGLNLYTIPTIHVGGTAIVQRTFDPIETFRLITEHTTVFFGVPAVYLFLSQHPDFEKTDLSRVRSWACGGAPMPVSLLKRYAARGIIIQQGFGMTETGPTVFLVDQTHALSKAGSVGKPQLYVEVRIVDRAGNDVPPGEMGELLIKGPGVTPGYWRLPKMTAQTIEDGWLHSGDVARCDEDGYYYIVDRWKDMYISGGENVYPAEVENVLFSHPAIAEVAVIGIPDQKWGEAGQAVVVLEAEQTLTEAEVIEFCQDKLARFKIPKSVIFVPSLPRNAAGKVKKNELRATI